MKREPTQMSQGANPAGQGKRDERMRGEIRDNDVSGRHRTGNWGIRITIQLVYKW